MGGFESARRRFEANGLPIPRVPAELAARLEEQKKWVYTTRPLKKSPYFLDEYVANVDQLESEDYAVLAHSGYGCNSYALQYYLVQGPLRLFLHLGWGGAYMNEKMARGKIRDCFAKADAIVAIVQAGASLGVGDRLTIVGSDFYGGFWEVAGERPRQRVEFHQPKAVLADVLSWLMNPDSSLDSSPVSGMPRLAGT